MKPRSVETEEEEDFCLGSLEDLSPVKAEDGGLHHKESTKRQFHQGEASPEDTPTVKYLEDFEKDCSNQWLQVGSMGFLHETPMRSTKRAAAIPPGRGSMGFLHETPMRSTKRPAAIPSGERKMGFLHETPMRSTAAAIPSGGKKSRLEYGLLSLAEAIEAQLAPAVMPRTEIDFFGDWIGAKCKEHCKGLNKQELLAFQEKILRCFTDY